MGDLTGKVAIVVGASSGMGEAIADRMVSEGAQVVVGCRSEPALNGVAWVPTDVVDPVAVDALVAAAIDLHGGMDVMVANAGVQIEKTVADTTDADFDQVIGVNVRVFSTVAGLQCVT